MSGMLAKGTPVISVESGVTLGKIEHVYLDCESLKLVAFTFTRSAGLLARKGGHIVEIDDIHAIGPDAVTLDDARVVHDLVLMDGATRHLVELDQLVKRPVMSDRGSKLGHIVGLDFDPTTYRLIDVRIDDRHLNDELVIACRDIRSIGEELIVVAEPAVETVDIDRVARPSPIPTQMDRGRHETDFRRTG